VIDGGDLPIAAFAPDPERPRAHNLSRLLGVLESVAGVVSDARAQHH